MAAGALTPRAHTPCTRHNTHNAYSYSTITIHSATTTARSTACGGRPRCPRTKCATSSSSAGRTWTPSAPTTPSGRIAPSPQVSRDPHNPQPPPPPPTPQRTRRQMKSWRRCSYPTSPTPSAASPWTRSSSRGSMKSECRQASPRRSGRWPARAGCARRGRGGYSTLDYTLDYTRSSLDYTRSSSVL